MIEHMQPQIIRKVALAYIKDRKLLMVRDFSRPKVFLTVGGKIEDGETDLDCLHREVMEEIGCGLVSDSTQFLKEFEAPAHNKENLRVNIRLYAGKLVGEPVPSSEVVELRYFNSAIQDKYIEGNIVGQEIIRWLNDQDMID
jgi:8-oxo-dGTP diphosphatase